MKNTQYKIAVATNSSGQSITDLQKTADRYGVVFDKVEFTNLPLFDFENCDMIKKLLKYDIVYYRTGMRDTTISELSHILKKKGVPLINGSETHPGIHKKIQQALFASRYDIPHPKSYVIPDFNYDVAVSLLGDKFVVKPDVGAKGNEVVLISNRGDLEKLKETAKKSKYLYQELITDADEYRVYTVGDRGVASYKRIANAGDFRANLHTGGRMEETEPERVQMLHDFGGYVAKCFGADISGVDVLIKDEKCLLIELNWQPGWENLDEMSGINFSIETIQHILNKAAEAST